MNEDINKAERLWQAMNKAFGEEKPFPAEQMQAVLDMAKEDMAKEDPERLIPCSCHGDMWQSRDVDVWGLCPSGRKV